MGVAQEQTPDVHAGARHAESRIGDHTIPHTEPVSACAHGAGETRSAPRRISLALRILGLLPSRLRGLP